MKSTNKLVKISLLLAFASCTLGSGGTSSGADTDKDQDQGEDTTKVYERLDDLANKDYLSVSLNIKTTTGIFELNSAYELTKESVVYSVEQFNMLPSDGNIDAANPSNKTTLSGTAVIVNDKVHSLDGDRVEIPAYDVLSGSFNFAESYFTNVEDSNGRFSADVTAVSDFFGAQNTAENMHVIVEYNTSSLESIVITYSTENSDVVITYEFS